VATDTDAARDRVLAARAALDTEIDRLEASARDAVDIPAKVRRSPAKAAAVAGGVGFLALKGPQRVFGAAKRAVGRGSRTDFPKSLLPDEIDKTLRKLGPDGDKVRGAIERDFAAYAKKAETDRRTARNLLLFAIARPLISAGTRAAAMALFTPEETRFDERMDAIRDRMKARVDEATAALRPDDAPPAAPRVDSPPPAPDDTAP
jgi:hypothetical protein